MDWVDIIGILYGSELVLALFYFWFMSKRVKKQDQKDQGFEDSVRAERLEETINEDYFRRVTEFYDGIGTVSETSREAPDRQLSSDHDRNRSDRHPSDRIPDWESLV